MASNCRYNSAVWAKEKAEAKFKVQDYQGAVDCAYIAKGIFPGLDGIDDLLAAYQVHLAAVKKDWSAVLGIDDSANLGEIKKQYKRKAMVVHPDKNSSEAATDAFKFVMEAYEVLSKNSQSALSSSWNQQSQPAAPASSQNHQSQPAAPASSSNHQSQSAAPASSSTSQFQPASSRFERPCPRCHKVCFFDTLKRTSITCRACGRRFVF